LAQAAHVWGQAEHNLVVILAYCFVGQAVVHCRIELSPKNPAGQLVA